jgi:hypothetical protein
MERDVMDDLESRLRGARPRSARVDETAFDEELLAHVRGQPIASRRTVPRAVALPVAAGLTLTATAVVMLGGGPGDVGGPSSASAITQALRWLDPPPGTILHTRSVETAGSETATTEFWQSSDHPGSQRALTDGAHAFEATPDQLYDPATDTIYDRAGPLAKGDIVGAKPDRAKRDAAKPDEPKTTAPAKGDAAKPEETTPAAPANGKPGSDSVPSGDPIVAKVRTLLSAGDMEVTGPENHDGTSAWVISLKAGAGRPVWKLWVSAADGRPLELRDPGRDAGEQPMVIRWSTYEVLPGSDADSVLTLTGAHPSARVVHDAEQAAAAEQRLGAKS